eukprot:1212797-Alexandrium_andersonii.AAC.1
MAGYLWALRPKPKFNRGCSGVPPNRGSSVNRAAPNVSQLMSETASGRFSPAKNCLRQVRAASGAFTQCQA